MGRVRKASWYAFSTVLLIASVLIYDYLSGLNGAIAALIFVFPVALWFPIGRKLEPAALVTFFFTIESVFHRNGGHDSTNAFGDHERKPLYFLADASYPNIPRRALRILAAVVGLSVWVTYTLKLRIEVDLFATALILSILVMTVLPFILFPIWIYEDAGLRYYDPRSTTVSTPGNVLKRFLTFTGFLIILATAIVYSAAKNPIFSLGELLGFILFMLGPAFLGADLFSMNIEPKLIEKFKMSKRIQMLPQASVQLLYHSTGVHNEPPNLPTSVAMLKCERCGSKIQPGYSFCGTCGSKISS
ncbi:MAG: zinc ribbon domain-containing protein [Nitrososphaerota archaeon]|nr:zinc ribbon domain-containing protein [Nitrososphaerota archaeon]